MQARADTLSTTFAALADPTRRAILSRLARGPATVTELLAPFSISGGRAAQWRPCRLEAAPLEKVALWTAEYRRFWDKSFDRLDDYLRELQARPRKVRNRKE